MKTLKQLIEENGGKLPLKVQDIEWAKDAVNMSSGSKPNDTSKRDLAAILEQSEKHK